MKKLCLALMILIMTLCMLGTAMANTGDSVDVIMILDYSGSMTENDSQRLMIKSAMNFIDMCDVSGSRVALIPFNSTTFLGNENWSRAFGYFRNVNSITEREAVRRDLLGIDYHYGSDTDGGPAFKKAWEVYNARANDPVANENAIVIFFSDGKIGVKNNPSYSQTSLAMANEHVDLFAGAGVPIYCIGLKGTGEFDKAWLDQIAEKTGTGAASVVFDGNSNELHETFSEIFATYLGTEPLVVDQRDIAVEENRAVISINIPNNSIIEANIRLSISDPNANSEFGDFFSLTNPNGQLIEPTTSGTPRDGSVIAGNSGAYYNVKLIRPMQGEWKLTLDVNNAQLVNAEMISNYDIAIRFRDVNVSELHKGDLLALEAEFYSTQTGDPYHDEYLYQMDLITQSTALYNGEPIENFYQVDAENNCFSGRIDRLENGTYTFQIKVNGAGIQTETETLTIDLDNRPPIRTGTDPEEIQLSVDSMLWRQATDMHTINLREYFRDPDGDPLTFLRVNMAGDSPIDTRITPDGKLEITGKKAGEISFAIKANDGMQDANRTLPLTITITSCTAQAIRELVLLIGSVLLVVIVLFIIARKRRGRFISSAAFETYYTKLSFQMLPHSMIYLSRYNDKTVSLYTVLNDAGAGEDTCNEIGSAERVALSGLTLKPKRKGELKLENNSNGSMAVSVSGAPLSRKKSILLHNGSNIQIDFNEPGRSISLLYRHE